jgi:hypothetical protein
VVAGELLDLKPEAVLILGRPDINRHARRNPHGPPRIRGDRRSGDAGLRGELGKARGQYHGLHTLRVFGPQPLETQIAPSIKRLAVIFHSDNPESYHFFVAPADHPLLNALKSLQKIEAILPGYWEPQEVAVA